MRQQRVSIGPLLDNHKPQRIFAIDMHGVREASGLLARAKHMFETQFAHLCEGIFPGRPAARHPDHPLPPPFGLPYRHEMESPALAKSTGCCGQRLSAAWPASVRT